MSDENRNKQELSEDAARAFRKEIGLPEVRSEPDAPKVDYELLNAFVTRSPMSDTDAEKVFDYLTRFESWRNAHNEVAIANFRRLRDKPSDPAPESS